MTATSTKPRAKAAPMVPAYTRPLRTYSPQIGKTAEERLALLRSTLHTADKKIEAAYDAAECGTPVKVLLRLIAHGLLITAMRPVLRNEDEGAIPVTKSDMDNAHEALFPLLAALEGAMALAAGTVLSATLAEAFNLLDWAQDECDSTALAAMLPLAPLPVAAESDATAAPKVRADWMEIGLATGDIGNGRILLEILMQEGSFDYTDPVDSSAAQSRILVLASAADDLFKKAEDFFEQLVGKVQEVNHA